MTIAGILSSKEKPKVKLEQLSNAVLSGKIAIKDLVSFYDEADKSEKGYLMESLEYTSQGKPEMVVSYVDFVIENINFPDSPRVRWEAARVIANLAAHSADKLEKAIDPLIKNTKDEGTVVRWSAAFALSELARNLESSRAKLEKLFVKLVKEEENNGVRKHYEKYLKEMS